MLERLRRLFPEQEESENNVEKMLRLATAALLVEVARADFERNRKEEKALAVQLKNILGISIEEVTKIISRAEHHVDQATSLYEFTNLVNENYSNHQKFSVLSSMWKIAYADGDIDRYEEHLIRRVAELIHLNHSDYIRAKLSARN